MTAAKRFVFIVDVGFLVYWSIIAFGLLPAEHLFKDYDNAIIQDWNLSFLPLDLAISATGLTALWLQRRGDPAWRTLLTVSMTLTFCSGLQAIAFWALRQDFDPLWWLPNLILMLGPVWLLPRALGDAPT